MSIRLGQGLIATIPAHRAGERFDVMGSFRMIAVMATLPGLPAPMS
jgi:hypothetical protein